VRRFILIALTAAALAVIAAPARAQGPAVGVRLVADGLTSPVALVQAPDGSGRNFVVDETGVIRVLNADGTLLPQPFLDVRSRMVPLMPDYDERGLLGLAFHPGYAGNGRFFVYYSAPLRAGAPPGYDHTARISEFRVSASDPNRADPASERVVLEVDKPQFNHNGGTVAFGPRDGYLYISIGDGGGADDVGLGHVEDWYTANAGGNGQDIQHNLLGDMGVRLPQPVPLLVRPGRQPRHAGGRRRPEPLGGGEPRCQGRQLRVERQGGHALLLHRQPGRDGRRLS
jgi:glucose/arabinose dehydrogenase